MPRTYGLFGSSSVTFTTAVQNLFLKNDECFDLQLQSLLGRPYTSERSDMQLRILKIKNRHTGDHEMKT